jgi:IS5 family transposase
VTSTIHWFTHTAFEELDEVCELLDWKAVERYLFDIHNQKQGQEAYPLIMMFKILLLQSWYNLSDPNPNKVVGLDSYVANGAIAQRKPETGLIIHSDRGSPYASHEYRVLLNRTGLQGNMSRKGVLG